MGIYKITILQVTSEECLNWLIWKLEKQLFCIRSGYVNQQMLTGGYIHGCVQIWGVYEFKNICGIQISKFHLSYKKLYERGIILWTMYNPTLLKPFKIFMAILWTKFILSWKFVELSNQI